MAIYPINKNFKFLLLLLFFLISIFFIFFFRDQLFEKTLLLKDEINKHLFAYSMIIIFFIIFWIVIQGFFSPIIFLVCILFDYISSVIILSIGSGIGSFFVYKIFKIKDTQIKMFKKIIDFLNKSPFFIFLFIRLSGGLGLPNQIQILIPSITNITDKKYIIANFFGQLPGFIIISYLINSLNTGSIESISDINIDKTYLITIGIIIFIIFIIPLIFKRLYESYIN